VKTRFVVLAIVASALMLGPALAMTEAELAKACKADVAKLCPKVPMGGGKILECLNSHKGDLTTACQEALAAEAAKAPAAGAPPAKQ